MLFDLLGYFLSGLGILLVLVSVFKAIRLSDFWSQLHVLSLVDTAGLVLVILGACLLVGFSMVTLRLFFLILLVFLVVPLNSYVLAQIKNAEDKSAQKQGDG